MKLQSDVELEKKVRELSPAKALALLGYGESVAAFRYRTLADRAPNPALRKALEEMADEEQGHHQMVQSLIDRHYPGLDFVLSNEDKNLVSVGVRQLNLTKPEAFSEVLNVIQAAERQTGKFYAALHRFPPHPQLAPWFKEMAEECFEHAERLMSLPPWEANEETAPG